MQPLGGSDFGAQLESMTTQLSQLAGRLDAAVASAAAQVYEVADPDGLIRATADGRPRIVALELDRRAAHTHGRRLGSLLVPVLNDVLAQARAGSGQALTEGLSPLLGGALGEALKGSGRGPAA